MTKPIDVSKLVKFSTYARKINKSCKHVYDLEKEGKITVVEIDTVKFVFLK